jgi:uncharacterized protein (TIGR03435 family)
MNRFRSVLLGALVPLAVFGQNAPARPEFEVASIKPSAPSGVDRANVGVRIDGAQVRCTYFSLKDYIGMAYRLRYYQITGPEWIGSERFDISAKLPAGAGREQVPEMVIALLADRFQLKAHRETKEFSVYALVVGKGELKLKESAADSSSEGADAGPGNVNVAASGGRGGVTVDLGRGSYFTAADNRFEARKLTMAGFVESLARFVDRPVLDMTGLTKSYDFTLTFSPEDFMGMMIQSAISAGVVLPPQALKALENASGDSLFTAVETLGLKLERRKAPLEVLVVDHMEKAPTEN